MASSLAGSLADISGAVLLLPRIIRSAMKVDTDAVLEAFGRNEQAKKVFWAVFIAFAGLVLAQVVDPATAQTILSLITGTG
jgi:hypothetical protein